MFQKLIFFFLCLGLYGLAQSPKVSFSEFGWALTHPFAALKIKKITKSCNERIQQHFITTQLDSFSNGGKADAFRHSFYMAAYAQKIKIGKLRKLGIAHEKTNYRQFVNSKSEEGEMADSLGCVMDLLNNELGFKIGSTNKKIKLEELSQLVIAEIKAGKALIMKRNKNGDYLDCKGKKLDLSLYKKVWAIPKCLEASDN